MKQEQGKPTPRAFFRPRDIAIVLVVLAAALLLWLLPRSKGPQARVSIGVGAAQRSQTIALNKDGRHEIDAALPVHLEVRDGAICFVDAECPDHLCEGFGWLRQEGDWAACVPAEVTVTVEGEG